MDGNPERGGYARKRVWVSWWLIGEETRRVHLVLYRFIPSAGGKVLWHVVLESARVGRPPELLRTVLTRPLKG